MVAGFHSLVGLAAVTTSIASYIAHPELMDPTHLTSTFLGAFIGAVTLTGARISNGIKKHPGNAYHSRGESQLGSLPSRPEDATPVPGIGKLWSIEHHFSVNTATSGGDGGRVPLLSPATECIQIPPGALPLCTPTELPRACCRLCGRIWQAAWRAPQQAAEPAGQKRAQHWLGGGQPRCWGSVPVHGGSHDRAGHAHSDQRSGRGHGCPHDGINWRCAPPRSSGMTTVVLNSSCLFNSATAGTLEHDQPHALRQLVWCDLGVFASKHVPSMPTIPRTS